MNKISARNRLKAETLLGLIHTQEGMKVNELHAHDISLDKEFLRLVRTVKNNATNSESAHGTVIYEPGPILRHQLSQNMLTFCTFSSLCN